MAEPDWNPDTAGRSLAEILREAGIESASRAARRRSWDDPEETGIRQRRAEAAAADRAGYGRRKSDRSLDEPPPVRDRPDFSRPAPEPSTAAIPGLRPERKPGVPSSTAHPSAPVDLDRRAGAPAGQRAADRTSQRASQRVAQRSPASTSIRRPGPSPSSGRTSSTPTSTPPRRRARSPGCASPGSC